ncbi:hypothetical protein HanXRQr2_Chr13g0571871 [Helianthus annuus]|uniref:Uncharacterized protein n=1 Tax=Helianthus annuus TaxID=4232 RepID=A0A251SNK7_HELAN|nr:hypothetical protein HanXRQr2_Chr13g0571871 [Helianthus annuus]
MRDRERERGRRERKNGRRRSDAAAHGGGSGGDDIPAIVVGDGGAVATIGRERKLRKVREPAVGTIDRQTLSLSGKVHRFRVVQIRRWFGSTTGAPEAVESTRSSRVNLVRVWSNFSQQVGSCQ